MSEISEPLAIGVELVVGGLAFWLILFMLDPEKTTLYVVLEDKPVNW